MRRTSLAVSLLVACMLLFPLAPGGFAQGADQAAALLGTWKITHRPVNEAGVPCPFLPESLQFFKDHSLVMSNFPGAHMPYKTDLTAAERAALEKRSGDYQGKALLLVKPNPAMDWSVTPMVYAYSVAKGKLSLTPQGWESATFQKVK